MVYLICEFVASTGGTGVRNCYISSGAGTNLNKVLSWENKTKRLGWIKYILRNFSRTSNKAHFSSLITYVYILINGFLDVQLATYVVWTIENILVFFFENMNLIYHVSKST